MFARYKFHQEVQQEGESFEQFLIDLKLLVKDCDYVDPDEMVRNRVIIGCNATKTRRRLIQEGSDLTLEKAIDIVRTDEISKAQFESMKKRKVPVSIEDKIKGELDRMEQTGVIVIQTVPMIIQEKPNRP